MAAIDALSNVIVHVAAVGWCGRDIHGLTFWSIRRRYRRWTLWDCTRANDRARVAPKGSFFFPISIVAAIAGAAVRAIVARVRSDEIVFMILCLDEVS